MGERGATGGGWEMLRVFPTLFDIWRNKEAWIIVVMRLNTRQAYDNRSFRIAFYGLVKESEMIGAGRRSVSAAFY